MITYVLHKDKLSNDITNYVDDKIEYYKVENEKDIKEEIEELKELEAEYPEIFKLIDYLIDYCDIADEAYDDFTVADLTFACDVIEKAVVINEDGDDLIRNENIKNGIIMKNKRLISALLENSTFAKPKMSDLF